MRTVKTVELFFQEGSSDKVYNARIVENAIGKHDVVVQWGRRGSTLNEGKKAIGVALDTAEKTLAKLVREKTGKGYQSVTEDAQPAAEAPPEGQGSGSKVTGKRARVGRVAQLLNAIEEEHLVRVFADDAMIAQQKLDGTRVLVHVESEVFATNRSGQLTNVPKAILDGAANLAPGTVLDGEVVADEEGTATYWMFDLLASGGEALIELGYADRWERLDGEVEPGVFGPLRVLPMAVGSEAKRALYQLLRAAQAEGIVFKQRDAPYRAGRPTSGGTQLKHKFVKSADVVIVENAGNAYRMVVQDGARPFDVGKVFAGTTNETRKRIDTLLAAGKTPVAEVRYLYATDDEQLFQPVFVRLRDDKRARDCARTQLTRTNRAVVTTFMP